MEAVGTKSGRAGGECRRHENRGAVGTERVTWGGNAVSMRKVALSEGWELQLLVMFFIGFAFTFVLIIFPLFLIFYGSMFSLYSC